MAEKSIFQMRSRMRDEIRSRMWGSADGHWWRLADRVVIRIGRGYVVGEWLANRIGGPIMLRCPAQRTNIIGRPERAAELAASCGQTVQSMAEAIDWLMESAVVRGLPAQKAGKFFSEKFQCHPSTGEKDSPPTRG